MVWSHINNHMKQETIQLLTMLSESMLAEASDLITTFGGIPGARALLEYLHKHNMLSHDQTLSEIDKVAWSNLKQGGRYWVLFKGTSGVAVMFSRKGSYTAYVGQADGEVITHSSESGGRILDWVKDHVGKIGKIYGGESSKNADKRRERAAARGREGDYEYTVNKLLDRTRPLWIKAVELALADVKGMMGTMIKNNSFDHAGKRMSHAKTLHSMLQDLQDGNMDRAYRVIRPYMERAVTMAAHHFYPEQTGDLRYERYGDPKGLLANSADGVRMLMKDIGGGDTAKLGTVIAFFKKGLMLP